AVLGVRSQGKALASRLCQLGDVDVVAICDVDQSVLPAASKSVEELQGQAPRWETDFRRLLDDPSIDALVIATPDHWHALMTIMACRAGKDVYVEKPVSHNLIEGERMVEAARQYDRVVQSGLQQRSGTHFRSAVELVQSGKLGTVSLARAWSVHRRKSIGFRNDGKTPNGVNYNLWLGPAPARDFNSNRFHHNWHWHWDYGTGELGNWGVHLLDVARWGLGVGLPNRVASTGGKYHFQDDQQTPDTQIVNFSYPQKTIVWEHRQWSTHGLEGRSAAVAFYGDAGTLVVDRGGWKVYDVRESLTSETSEQQTAHLRNFIDCIRTREHPSADIAIGHLSSALCHLGNVSHRVGRELHFDTVANRCTDDPQANALLGREYREEWSEQIV
ncbi:MAG: dehydrogenase, partial [Planctomycetaceae bacterium]|nr:dehydrogenase [Planctomycetaceae bacterium]